MAQRVSRNLLSRKCWTLGRDSKSWLLRTDCRCRSLLALSVVDCRTKSATIVLTSYRFDRPPKFPHYPYKDGAGARHAIRIDAAIDAATSAKGLICQPMPRKWRGLRTSTAIPMARNTWRLRPPLPIIRSAANGKATGSAGLPKKLIQSDG